MCNPLTLRLLVLLPFVLFVFYLQYEPWRTSTSPPCLFVQPHNLILHSGPIYVFKEGHRTTGGEHNTRNTGEQEVQNSKIQEAITTEQNQTKNPNHDSLRLKGKMLFG